MDEGRPALRAKAAARRRPGFGFPRGRAAAAFLLAAPLGFLVLFLAYPLQGILRESFFGEHGSLNGLRPLVADTFYLERAWFTLWQAAASTALTLALALPCAWALARDDFRGKTLLVAVATVPFVLPTIVVAVAFTALVGPDGALNRFLSWAFHLDQAPIDVLNTVWIILAAHVFYNFAVAARLIAAYWSKLDPRMDDAAAVLGCGRWRRFWLVTLPLLRPAVLAAASLVFLFTFTSFGVVLILGGSSYGTIETEIYRETVFLFRLPVAGALALIQAVFTFVVMVVYTRLAGAAPGGAFEGHPARQDSARDRWTAAAMIALMLTLTLLPLGALVERSFHGAGGYTLEFYRSLGENARNQALFVTPLRAIANSLRFAGLVVLFALPIGTLAAYGARAAGRAGPWLEAVLLLPLGVSAVTLGLGFLVTLDEPPLNLRGSWWLLVVAHTLVAYPFVARSVGAQLRGIDPRWREAAAILGAGPIGSFLRVDLPLIWRGMAAGAVLAFAVSMGEFGATLLISRPEWATIPVAIFRYLGQPGSLPYGQALAMSTILMAVTATGFFLLDRLRYRALGAF